MERPSNVEVPRPSSSIMTKLWSVALPKILFFVVYKKKKQQPKSTNQSLYILK